MWNLNRLRYERQHSRQGLLRPSVPGWVVGYVPEAIEGIYQYELPLGALRLAPFQEGCATCRYLNLRYLESGLYRQLFLKSWTQHYSQMHQKGWPSTTSVHYPRHVAAEYNPCQGHLFRTPCEHMFPYCSESHPIGPCAGGDQVAEIFRNSVDQFLGALVLQLRQSSGLPWVLEPLEEPLRPISSLGA